MSRLPVPPSDQMRASGTARRKVALPPGRSQLDWVRNSARISRPPYPRAAISARELRAHRSRHDAWIAVHGKVFDVTPYVEYHPGGVDIILAAAGKDGTKLFNKYHSWVNPDFMLARCYLGLLDANDHANTQTDSDTQTETESETESDSDDKDIDNNDVSLSDKSSLQNNPETIPQSTSRPSSHSTTTSRSRDAHPDDLTKDLVAFRIAELEQ